MTRRGFVLGTAGHVDHGKSALVFRLTGKDPDRLPEEKRRGMTIDLGFAELILPSGNSVSLVDVPGHERFITNMVAGATGLDGALMVVAADEGVMPQTLEHAAILGLLGVEACVLVLTKSDLVSADLLAISKIEAVEAMEGLGLSVAGVTAVSSVTGEGIPELVTELESYTAQRVSQDQTVSFLPIDRVFRSHGYGTVVTGTLAGEPLVRGEEVEIFPAEVRARVRGIQVHGGEVTEASAGRRVALNLAGLSHSRVQRGQVVGHPGEIAGVKRFEALVTWLPNAPVALGPSTDLVVHIGADAVEARVFPLEAAAGDFRSTPIWCQIRLVRQLAVHRRQRFVLRVASPPATVGGGVIADLRPRRRAHADDFGRLNGMLATEVGSVVDALLADTMLAKEELVRRTSVPAPVLGQATDGLVERGRVVRLGDRYMGADRRARLTEEALGLIRGYHDRYPLRRGIPKEELRRTLRIDRARFEDFVRLCVADGMVTVVQPADGKTAELSLADHHDQGSSVIEEQGSKELVAALESGRFSPPEIEQVMKRCGVDTESLRHLREAGMVVKISDGVYLGKQAYRDMVNEVVDLIQRDGQASIAAIRDRLGSSRKYVLSYMEHLDNERITRRVGDERVAGSRAGAHRI